MSYLYAMEQLEVHVRQIDARVAKTEIFLCRFLNPEDLSHAVTAEVRDEARALLGMKRVEGGGR